MATATKTRTPRRGDLAVLGGSRIEHFCWIAGVELDDEGRPASYEVMAMSSTRLTDGNPIKVNANEVITVVPNILEAEAE